MYLCICIIFVQNLTTDSMDKSFLAFVEESIKKNWDLDALTDYKGATLQYKDVARKIEKLHMFALGRGFSGNPDLRGCGRTHPARVQGRQHPQYSKPLRRAPAVCGRHGMGIAERG